MKRKFKTCEKVVICNSELIDNDSMSVISDFVCYGNALNTYSEEIDGVMTTCIKAIGSNGNIYIDRDDPDGIYFLSEDEFMERLAIEKTLFPDRIDKINEMELALKVFYMG